MTKTKTLTRSAIAPFMALSLTLSLGACGISLIDTQPPPQIFDLTAPTSLSGGDAVSWQLIVEEPESVKALGTNRIALRDADASIKYYKGARWSDRGPVLIQARLIEALENSGRIMSVGSETSGLNASFRLKSNLRDFHADVSNARAPTITVTLNAKLFNARTRNIVATKLISAQVEASSGKTRAIVKAFDEAAQDVTRQAVAWVLEAGEGE
jgi:cholesterol transport system auxiliary component